MWLDPRNHALRYQSPQVVHFSQENDNMTDRKLQDRPAVFEVTVLRPAKPSSTVLFAVGGGGDPRRHLPLLESLAEYGCTVVAPHFDRLPSLSPTEDQLLLRAHRSSVESHQADSAGGDRLVQADLRPRCRKHSRERERRCRCFAPGTREPGGAGESACAECPYTPSPESSAA